MTRLVMKARSKVFREAGENSRCRGGHRTHLPTSSTRALSRRTCVLRYVKDRTGCRILHAPERPTRLATFGVMTPYLDGVCQRGQRGKAGPRGVRKGGPHLPVRHTLKRTYGRSSGILIASFQFIHQLGRYGEAARRLGRGIGLRVNPGHAEVQTCTPLCSPFETKEWCTTSSSAAFPAVARPGSRPAFSRDVRAEFRCPSKNPQVLRTSLRAVPEGPQVGELRRRSS